MTLKSITDNPWFSLTSYIIGFIGFVFAIYTYQVTKQYGRVYYWVASKVIYAPVIGDAATGRVLAPGLAADEAIHVTQLTIWNAGKVSIEPKDQRSDFLIRGDARFRIYDYRIFNKKSLMQDNLSIDSGDSRSIKLSWKIFDPDDAVKIQIVHNGNPNAIFASGRFAPNIEVMRWSGNPLVLWAFFVFGVGTLFFLLIYLRPMVWSTLRSFGAFTQGIAEVLYIILAVALAGGSGFLAADFVRKQVGEEAPITFSFEGKGGMEPLRIE